MTVPFMRAYTELLVRTCHKRGAHAIGGMAAFIPSKDPEVNEAAFEQGPRRQDARGRRRLRRLLGGPPRHGADLQGGLRPRSSATGRTSWTSSARTSTSPPSSCSTSRSTPGEVTEAGPAQQHQRRHPVPRRPGCSGSGAVGIYNLMEDAATAEISPLAGLAVAAQRRRRSTPVDGVTARELVERLVDEEIAKLAGRRPSRRTADAAQRCSLEVALADDSPSSSRCPAYERCRDRSTASGPGTPSAGVRPAVAGPQRGIAAAAAAGLLGDDAVITDHQRLRTYECDGLAHYKVTPALVVLPETTAQVAAVVRACAERRACRSWPAGSGTGLSGGALPHADGVLIVTSRMRTHPRGRPGQPAGGRRARASSTCSVTREATAARLLLRPRPLQPAGLLDRRQRRGELRRRALPEVRLHHQPRHRRRAGHARTARWCSSAARRRTPPATTCSARSSAPRARSASPPR